MINYFGEFKQKFLEANLDKVISLQELKSIAEAIGKRDWGYVKYILTIICLMLKSYQNISKNCNEEMLLTPTPIKPELSGMIKKMNAKTSNELSCEPSNNNGIIVPEKRNIFMKQKVANEQRQLSKDDIKNQLNSLNNIFTKMKKIDVQMNISHCSKCQKQYCSHNHNHFQPELTSGFQEVNVRPNPQINNVEQFITESSAFSNLPKNQHRLD